MKIIKRNGEVVQYDVEKIRRAIEKSVLVRLFCVREAFERKFKKMDIT